MRGLRGCGQILPWRGWRFLGVGGCADNAEEMTVLTRAVRIEPAAIERSTNVFICTDSLIVAECSWTASAVRGAWTRGRGAPLLTSAAFFRGWLFGQALGMTVVPRTDGAA